MERGDPPIGLLALLPKMGLRLPDRPCTESMLKVLAAEVRRLGWPARWIEDRTLLDHGSSGATERELRQKRLCEVWGSWSISETGRERIRQAQLRRRSA